MTLVTHPEASREHVFAAVEDALREAGLRVVAKDDGRPWGGFFVIDEAQAAEFIRRYFPEEDPAELTRRKVSPKILLVAPGMRLSWQYHHRRAELWRVVEGGVEVMRSATDDEGPVTRLDPGGVIRLAQGERHRLIGRDAWGVVAEIWRHTDESHPSDEQDIVRVQDDFGRR